MRDLKNTLIQGDPLKPDDLDLIAQTATIRVEEPVPDGWQVLTGNIFNSRIARVAFRYEIKNKKKKGK